MADIISMRLDKWLWVARFFKTRSLASEAIAKGHTEVNGLPAKASRELKAGDTLSMRYSAYNVNLTRTLVVQGVAPTRGSATVAQSLYSETPASIQAREAAQAQRIFHTEPAHSISGGRPSKKDRRDMNQMQTAPQWDARWSAKAEN